MQTQSAHGSVHVNGNNIQHPLASCITLAHTCFSRTMWQCCPAWMHHGSGWWIALGCCAAHSHPDDGRCSRDADAASRGVMSHASKPHCMVIWLLCDWQRRMTQPGHIHLCMQQVSTSTSHSFIHSMNNNQSMSHLMIRATSQCACRTQTVPCLPHIHLIHSLIPSHTSICTQHTWSMTRQSTFTSTLTHSPITQSHSSTHLDSPHMRRATPAAASDGCTSPPSIHGVHHGMDA